VETLADATGADIVETLPCSTDASSDDDAGMLLITYHIICSETTVSLNIHCKACKPVNSLFDCNAVVINYIYLHTAAAFLKSYHLFSVCDCQ